MRISDFYPNETQWRSTKLGVQGSPEWRRARLGKVTASRVADVAAKTKSGLSASRANYMAELLIEQLIGGEAEHFHSKAMERGLEIEVAARDAYRSRVTNYIVEETGFIQHPIIEMAGASPDGLVGGDGLVSFKCPHAATHLELLLGGAIPTKYMLQMQWEMACCPERMWCDFVDYDPRFPRSMQLLVKRIERDQAAIGRLEDEVVKFLIELDNKIFELKRTYETGADSSPAPQAATDCG